MASPTQVGSAVVSQADTGSLTFKDVAYTVPGSITNGLLLICSFYDNGSGPSSVTDDNGTVAHYNSKLEVVGSADGITRGVDIHYVLNPTAGVHNVRSTLGGVQGVAAMMFQNVNQSSPFGTVLNVSHTSKLPVVTANMTGNVAGASGDLALAVCGTADDFGDATNGLQTAHTTIFRGRESVFGAGSWLLARIAAVSTSTAFTFSLPNQVSDGGDLIRGFVLQQDGGGGGGPGGAGFFFGRRGT